MINAMIFSIELAHAGTTDRMLFVIRHQFDNGESEKIGGKVVGLSFVVELDFLNGRDRRQPTRSRR